MSRRHGGSHTVYFDPKDPSTWEAFEEDDEAADELSAQEAVMKLPSPRRVPRRASAPQPSGGGGGAPRRASAPQPFGAPRRTGLGARKLSGPIGTIDWEDQKDLAARRSSAVQDVNEAVEGGDGSAPVKAAEALSEMIGQAKDLKEQVDEAARQIPNDLPTTYAHAKANVEIARGIQGTVGGLTQISEGIGSEARKLIESFGTAWFEEHMGAELDDLNSHISGVNEQIQTNPFEQRVEKSYLAALQRTGYVKPNPSVNLTPLTEEEALQNIQSSSKFAEKLRNEVQGYKKQLLDIPSVDMLGPDSVDDLRASIEARKGIQKKVEPLTKNLQNIYEAIQQDKERLGDGGRNVWGKLQEIKNVLGETEEIIEEIVINPVAPGVEQPSITSPVQTGNGYRPNTIIEPRKGEKGSGWMSTMSRESKRIFGLAYGLLRKPKETKETVYEDDFEPDDESGDDYESDFELDETASQPAEEEGDFKDAFEPGQRDGARRRVPRNQRAGDGGRRMGATKIEGPIEPLLWDDDDGLRDPEDGVADVAPEQHVSDKYHGLRNRRKATSSKELDLEKDHRFMVLGQALFESLVAADSPLLVMDDSRLQYFAGCMASSLLSPPPSGTMVTHDGFLRALKDMRSSVERGDPDAQCHRFMTELYDCLQALDPDFLHSLPLVEVTDNTSALDWVKEKRHNWVDLPLFKEHTIFVDMVDAHISRKAKESTKIIPYQDMGSEITRVSRDAGKLLQSFLICNSMVWRTEIDPRTGNAALIKTHPVFIYRELRIRAAELQNSAIHHDDTMTVDEKAQMEGVMDIIEMEVDKAYVDFRSSVTGARWKKAYTPLAAVALIGMAVGIVGTRAALPATSCPLPSYIESGVGADLRLVRQTAVRSNPNLLSDMDRNVTMWASCTDRKNTAIGSQLETLQVEIQTARKEIEDTKKADQVISGLVAKAARTRVSTRDEIHKSLKMRDEISNAPKTAPGPIEDARVVQALADLNGKIINFAKSETQRLEKKYSARPAGVETYEKLDSLFDEVFALANVLYLNGFEEACPETRVLGQRIYLDIFNQKQSDEEITARTTKVLDAHRDYSGIALRSFLEPSDHVTLSTFRDHKFAEPNSRMKFEAKQLLQMDEHAREVTGPIITAIGKFVGLYKDYLPAKVQLTRSWYLLHEWINAVLKEDAKSLIQDHIKTLDDSYDEYSGRESKSWVPPVKHLYAILSPEQKINDFIGLICDLADARNAGFGGGREVVRIGHMATEAAKVFDYTPDARVGYCLLQAIDIKETMARCGKTDDVMVDKLIGYCKSHAAISPDNRFWTGAVEILSRESTPQAIYHQLTSLVYSAMRFALEAGHGIMSYVMPAAAHYLEALMPSDRSEAIVPI